MDAQPGADPLQSFGAIGGAIINDQLERNAAPEHRLLEHAFDVQGGLARAEGAVREQPGGVVEQ